MSKRSSNLIFILVALNVSQIHSHITEDMALNSSDYLNVMSKVMSTYGTNSLADNVRQMRSVVDREAMPTYRCQSVIFYFGLIMSQFIQCVLINDNPFNVCRNCCQQFTDLYHSYGDLTNDSVSNCSDSLRTDLIDDLYGNAISQWTDGNCNNCFSGEDENQNLVVNNDTNYFFRLLDDYILCVENVSKLHTSNDSCDECKQRFETINDFYDSILTNYSSHVCKDIIDSMKNIRWHWSEKLDCPIDHKTSYHFIALVITVSVLPFALYLTGRLFCVERYKTLMRQKRLSTYHTSYENKPLIDK